MQQKKNFGLGYEKNEPLQFCGGSFAILAC